MLHGLDAVRADAERSAGVRADDVLACSSAGGGLRIAVVGYERLVTAEAGRRVALSAGGRVVHVPPGRSTRPGSARSGRRGPTSCCSSAAPTAGTPRCCSPTPAGSPPHGSGRRSSSPATARRRPTRSRQLERTGRRVVLAPNVLPRIGVLEPLGARSAIRELFLEHVIGGKGLSRGRRFARLVRAPTPDAVLTGVEVLAEVAGDVLVVDVGGATTDVYSVLTTPASGAVAGDATAVRTVEGDLGMRWSARGVVAAAIAERLLPPDDPLAAYAAAVAEEPGRLPDGAAEVECDLRLAELAVTVALRRHGRAPTPSAPPRPLRDVRLVVGSGGVLRHAGDAGRRRVLAPATSDHAGGWRVPERARTTVDGRYVLFAAGLLAGTGRREAARALAEVTR